MTAAPRRSAATPRRAARGLLLALALTVCGPPAAAFEADPLAGAQALYRRGAMTAAAAEARRADGADGLTLAARATLVEALYVAPAAARQVLVERAIEDARGALAQSPDHYGAHLQLALALGALAELEGPIAAHLQGLASEGRALLERARQLAPAGDPWPDGLLGIWHLQLVHFGSAALAAELYGASAEAGLALCRRAAAEAPGALALRYGCASSMLDLDPAGLGPEALAELAAIVALPAADAAERLVQGAARRRIAEAGRAAR
jgi:hypothetical protein